MAKTDMPTIEEKVNEEAVPQVECDTTPRVCSQNDRAPQGMCRFKIRCVEVHPAPTKYVLAPTLEEAGKEFCRVMGLPFKTRLLIQRLPD